VDDVTKMTQGELAQEINRRLGREIMGDDPSAELRDMMRLFNEMQKAGFGAACHLDCIAGFGWSVWFQGRLHTGNASAGSQVYCDGKVDERDLSLWRAAVEAAVRSLRKLVGIEAAGGPTFATRVVEITTHFASGYSAQLSARGPSATVIHELCNMPFLVPDVAVPTISVLAASLDRILETLVSRGFVVVFKKAED
jgi:hypothetical protein